MQEERASGLPLPQKSSSHKKAQRAQSISADFLCLLCSFAADLPAIPVLMHGRGLLVQVRLFTFEGKLLVVQITQPGVNNFYFKGISNAEAPVLNVSVVPLCDATVSASPKHRCR
jgi:hypothetical protein